MGLYLLEKNIVSKLTVCMAEGAKGLHSGFWVSLMNTDTGEIVTDWFYRSREKAEMQFNSTCCALYTMVALKYECPECKGKGVVEVLEEGCPVERDCRACEGNGHQYSI